MFCGVLMKKASELGIRVPYTEFSYHAIKALEEHWEVISNQGVEGGTTVNTHRTIDFIFHYKRSTPVQVLGATTLVLFHNGDANKASDHYPIYVDVKW